MLFRDIFVGNLALALALALLPINVAPIYNQRDCPLQLALTSDSQLLLTNISHKKLTSFTLGCFRDDVDPAILEWRLPESPVPIEPGSSVLELSPRGTSMTSCSTGKFAVGVVTVQDPDGVWETASRIDRLKLR